MTTILAIDSSNFPLGIALIADGKVIAERITNLPKNHSTRVMPAIVELMQECEIKPENLTKIVVANGPGSYTGVRIGVTIAKSLAWTLGIPITTVSSLKVLAATGGRNYNSYLSPIIDARRGNVYAGLYKFVNNKLQVIIPDQYVSFIDWLEKLKQFDSEVMFVGNDIVKHNEALAKEKDLQFKIAFQTNNNPRPSELALLGIDKQAEDVHFVVPNYLRLAEAEANWLKENK